MPQQKYTNNRYIDLLRTKIVVFDGAMGTSLQKMNLTAQDFGGEKFFGCNDYLVISCPSAVADVHKSFLDAGVDVIETCTFRANRITMAEYGLQDRVPEINIAAAKLARKIADEYSSPTQPRLVAGSIGPSGKLPSMEDPQLSDVSFDDLKSVFFEQAKSLIEGGVDLLLIETSQDILEVKAVIHGIQQAFEVTGTSLPIQAQVTLDTSGRMLLGTDILAVLAILAGMNVDVIGLNCSTGPEHMREPIRILGENSPLPISCIPNAGLPLNVDGQAVYPLEPEPFAEMLVDFASKHRVRVVGGCCGTTPEHMRLLVEKVNEIPVPEQKNEFPPLLASSSQAVPMEQDPRPFFIGERLNTQGSAKFKKILLAEDYDSVVELARNQVDGGAHGLDICTALTENSDEKKLMEKVIKKLSTAVKAPFIIDTTEPDVMEAALKIAPGRCLINSTNLESGQAKAALIFGLAKKYNAAVIALTIDEKGMAKTAQRKLEISQRLFDIATSKYGLRPGDLVIDDLTFTLSTGDKEFSDSARETLEGIRLIKKNLPGVLTSLGVSNVSFGLQPNTRQVLNSVFLYHAVQSGLDMAIVNPAQLIPYTDIPQVEIDLCEDLIFNKHPDALQKIIEHFASDNATSMKENQSNPMEGMSAGERLQWKILHRKKENLEADIDELVKTVDLENRNEKAVEVLNTVLLPAMKEVGDRFGAGELILPFVLQSAEVMKKAVTHLEQYLERKEGTSKGRVVLATVYGDVHDIGKNLVKTILSNNGYEVFDLGKQVPADTILQKADELQADAIGLSALLVSTSKQMPLIVNELARRGKDLPVLIGGAAINRRFGRRILQTDDGGYYPGGVFYCKDAFEGLSTLDQLVEPESKKALMEQILAEADQELGRSIETSKPVSTNIRSTKITPAEMIPQPPDFGVHVVKQMPVQEVAKNISINELFRLSWGAKNLHGSEWEALKRNYQERLEQMTREAQAQKWLHPKGVFGYFPAQADGNDLLVYDPKNMNDKTPRVLEKFSFPRQKEEDGISLADYFSTVDSGIMDVVVFQVVTVGKEATERFDRMQESGDYTEAYFSHGFAVQMAEAAANYLHNHIRRQLGLSDTQGKRYSWGYPAIPELSDHAKVFRLLPAEKELGMTLTSAYQLVPEQSTAAIILHHPQASYFNIGESRIEQLSKGK